MQFLTNKEVTYIRKLIKFQTKKFLILKKTTKKEQDKNEPAIAPIPLIKCRYCKGDHWSAKCPHKDILEERYNEQATKAAAGKKSIKRI
jgi:hypothetical protein